MTEKILEVRRLVTAFAGEQGLLRAVDGVSFNLKRGRTLGLVGESGSGKSVTSLSLVDLLPKPSGRILEGEILYKGKDLRQISTAELHRLRGGQIAMIFQEPMTSLNPVKKVGRQLAEMFQIHHPSLSTGEVQERCLSLLNEVGIPNPKQKLDDYPHQLSGGMRQRVMIAMALACEPEVLIADEPTTALDVTIQAQILNLIQRLQETHNMAVIFITHDLGVIAEIAHDVAVMYGGRIVESAPVEELFRRPLHPYTKGLLASIPRLSDQPKSRLATIQGMVPPLSAMPVGCHFRNRCQFADTTCHSEPVLEMVPDSDHGVACCHWSKLEGDL
jgi:oligopeptide/dipeptide ABC transporter ATP-binding protein